MKGKEYKNKKESNKSKDVFYFKFNDEEFSDVKSREVYKNKGIEIHFPFYNGRQKYRYIEEIEFKNISPESIKGVKKAVSGGLGFTRDLSPVINELENHPSIKKIIISKDDDTKIVRTNITFNVSDLINLYKIIRPFNEKQSEEKKKITNNILSDILPKKFKKINSRYNKGDLLEFIVNKDLANNTISDEDVEHIVKILPKEIKEQQLVYRIEEKIETVKIKNAQRGFEKIASQTTDSKVLESKWHEFFKENDWIFSHVLLLPVSIYDDEVYVGGKNAKNKDGKVADFLYKNSLTNNACLIEIKTHKTKICNKTPYRGTNVFELNGAFTGAINQALVERHKIQRDYGVLLAEEKESDKADEFFDVFNPKLVVIAGSLKDMTKKQRNNFEIYRNSMNQVDIITFDEVQEKIQYFFDLLNVEK